MITQCTGCQARYRLDATKVPARMIRVRCPACATVFDLDGASRPAPADDLVLPQQPEPTTAPAPAPVLQEPADPAAGPGLAARPPEPEPQPPEPELEPEPVFVSAEPPCRPQAAEAHPQGAGLASARGDEGASVADGLRTGRRRRRDKTEMLARALVSDILVYNQAARDKALAEDNLLEVLGPEIKKSWELFKEKVGPQAAAAGSQFKDALNEILADGRKVF